MILHRIYGGSRHEVQQNTEAYDTDPDHAKFSWVFMLSIVEEAVINISIVCLHSHLSLYKPVRHEASMAGQQLIQLIWTCTEFLIF